MDIKRFITLSVSLKFSFAILSLLLIRVHFITGQSGKVLLDSEQSISTVRSALDHGANVNIRNKDGFSALMLGSQRGNLERVRLLLAHGANVNLASYKNKETALHLAAGNAGQSGSLAVIPLLLHYGADVRAQDKIGNTALHKALNVKGSYENRMKVFSELVKNGADINAQNKRGYTPLHVAINMRDRQGIQQLMNIFGQLFDLRKKTKQEKLTPIAFAQDIGDTEIIDILKTPRKAFGLKGDVNRYNQVGLNGLILAVIANNKKLVQRLLLRGADINFRSRDDFQYSPLQFAFLYKNFAMAELLLKNNSNPSLKNKQGDTAVHIILRLPSLAMQKKALLLLVKYNTDLNVRDNKGETILHRVVRKNDKKLLDYLAKNFKKKLNAQIQNLNYETPIALARILGRKHLIPILEKLHGR